MSFKSSRNKFAGGPKGALFLAGVLTAALSAQAQVVSVIDDFEAGSNQNKFMGYSYFYADAADQGTSKVISSKPGATASELLFDPTLSIDAGYNSTKALKLQFQYGTNKPVSCGGTCSYGQMVGFGTQLIAGTDPIGAGEGKTLDMTGATGITFWAKASVAMKVRVEITTTTVKDYAFHRGEVTVGTAWAQQVVMLTPGLGGINQPSWTTAPLVFDPAKVQKLQFQVSADDNATLTAGTLWLDNIQVSGYSWVPASACIPCVGTVPGTGALLSDLEPGPGTPPRAANQNAAGGFWFAYNDVGTRTVAAQSEYSEIFEGADLTDPKVPILKITPAKGAATSAGAYIKFALGPTYSDGGPAPVMPFVGLGTKTSDDLETMVMDATGSTGINFDYWTDAASTFKFVRLEVKSNQTDLGANKGVIHSVLLPATAGTWKTAIVPWSKLSLPDWDEVPNKLAPLKTSGISKFQWAVQDVPGTTGALAVDNVKITGLTTVPPLSIRAVGRASQGMKLSQAVGRLNVDFNIPGAAKAAQVSLVDLKGAVAASQSLTGNGSLQASLDTRGLRSGLYTLHVRRGNVVRSAAVTLLK